MPRYSKHARHSQVKSVNDTRSIFQCKPACGEQGQSISDIVDALQATHVMDEKNKMQYFESNGLDYKRVIKYLTTVMTLNHTYQQHIHKINERSESL